MGKTCRFLIPKWLQTWDSNMSSKCMCLWNFSWPQDQGYISKGWYRISGAKNTTLFQGKSSDRCSIILKFQLEKVFGILYRNKGPLEKAPKHSPAWTVAFKACSQSKGPSNWSACVLKMSWRSHTTKLYTTHHLMLYPIRYIVFISYFINISGFSKLNQIVIIYVPYKFAFLHCLFF